MRTDTVLRLAGLVLTRLLAVPALFGTDYTFTKITDDAPGSTLGLATFRGPFLINSSGAVAFSAAPASTLENGIYSLSINTGTVAFYASGTASGTGCNCGIYTKGSGAATPVAPVQENISYAPQINDNGAVAFAGSYQGVTGVFIASGNRRRRNSGGLIRGWPLLCKS